MTALGLERYLLDDDTAGWAAGFVRKLAEGRPVPEYGSEDWQAAPWQLQVASAVRAAEVRRRDALFLPLALADELAAGRYWHEVAEAQAFTEVAARVRAMADSPTHAQLVERRAA